MGDCRTAEELLSSALSIIDYAYKNHSVWGMIPLFSGGHDSYCACYAASRYKRFKGEVFHIDTGIGSEKTKNFVQRVCDEEGWRLRVYKSGSKRRSYEFIVRQFGFPGPPMHKICYNSLKETPIHSMTRVRRIVLAGSMWLLVTGARQQESVRRMGTTRPIQVGDYIKPGEEKGKGRRIWVSPCYDWSSLEQKTFMDYYRLPRNPVKESPLAMSGECFCGAFARPYELDLIREVCPDVAQEIDRLAEVAKSCHKPCIWGHQGKLTSEVIPATGPLCTSCDFKLSAAGVQFVK